jgi:hypothetical protein
VHRVDKGRKVLIQVTKELKGRHLKVLKEPKVLIRGLKVQQGLKETKVFKEPKGYLKEPKELKVIQEILGQQELKVVYKELKVLQVFKVI